MERLKNNFRKLRWQLTFSYTAVTVATLLVITVIIAAVFFSKILLPYGAITPQDWINIATDQIQVGYGWLMSGDGIRKEYLREVVNTENSIITQRLFLFADLEINARSSGKLDVIVFDTQKVLWAVTSVNDPPLFPQSAIGTQVDTALVPGLADPLEAALQGKNDAKSVFSELDAGDSFTFAIPLFNEEEGNGEVIGAVAIHVRDLSTEGDRLPYLGLVFTRTLLIILSVAVVVGSVFGGLTAEGLSGRFRRVAEKATAWSQGDLRERIDDRSGDEIGVLAGKLDGMAQELQELLQKRQELAVLEERNRLARDLHDSAKQLALAASFQVGAARELFERDPQQAYQHLHEAEVLVDRVRRELTDLILELRPPQVDDRPLYELLEGYAVEWANQNEISMETDLQPTDGVPLESKLCLYRILQEALANIARHSQASEVHLTLKIDTESLFMSVCDNGSGFNPTQPQEGLGLRSMRERAEAGGGEFTLTSTDGQGTCIEVRVPVREREIDHA